VSLIDLMPVLCRYSGLACPADAAGGDAIFRGGAPPHRHVVVEGQRTSRRNRGLIGERYKLISQPDRRAGEAPYRLYDLSADPDETRDLLAGGALAEDARDAFERLRHALPGAVTPRARTRSERVPVEPDLAERLRALGYAEGDESEAPAAGP
jgi:arylsulfatase A-like enzyme